MRTLFVPLILLSVVGCSSCAGLRANPRSTPKSEMIDRIEDATAALIGRDDVGDFAAVCSAVWVTEVDLLSAAHCAKLAFPVSETASEEEPNPVGHEIEYVTHRDLGSQALDDVSPSGTAIVVAIDEAHDLMLLSGHREHHGVARLARGTVRQGDDVWTMGMTLGLPYSLSNGMIGADRWMYRRPGQRMHVLQIVSGASHGNSGGGVWSEDGELLGICSFIARDSILTFAVHRDTVWRFLLGQGVTPA